MVDPMDPTVLTPPDVDTAPTPLPPPVMLPTPQGPTVFSPSPNQGEQNPKRREEDQKRYGAHWTAVGTGLLVWSVSFFNEVSGKTLPEIQTLKFVAEHAAQVLGVIAAVIAAKQIKS